MARWAALAVAGVSFGVGLPRALPSIFNRRPEVRRDREQRVNFLVRGLVVLGFTSYLVAVPEWGPTWDLVSAAVTFAGGVVLAGALPRASRSPRPAPSAYLGTAATGDLLEPFGAERSQGRPANCSR